MSDLIEIAFGFAAGSAAWPLWYMASLVASNYCWRWRRRLAGKR